MPAAARIGDTNSVHECGVVPTASSGSSNVFINGIPAHRVGDSNTAHPFAPPPVGCPTHVTTVSSGSPNVFVNGQALARVGDPYTCGITVTSGSPNVFANDAYTATETDYPKMTHQAIDRFSVLEMIATLLFGSMAHADPIDHLDEEDFKSIFVEKDKSKYYSTEAFYEAADEVRKNMDDTTEAVNMFRGGEGYNAKGKLLTHDEFMNSYGEEIRNYGKLRDEYEFLHEKTKVFYTDPEIGRRMKFDFDQLTPDEIDRFNELAFHVEDIEQELVDNIHHKNIADVLWKHSSVKIDKPMFIKREFDKYANEFYDKEFVPPKPGSTYSATVVDIEEVNYTSAKMESRATQYWLLPKGTRIVHTAGLADHHEVLVIGDDLLNTRLLFSGSTLQHVKMAIDEKGFIDKELYNELLEEYKARNDGKNPPKWWMDMVEDLDNIIESAETGKIRNWRAQLLIAVLTGTGSWFADTDEYWDIFNSKDMADYQNKLTNYYGFSTGEFIGVNNPNISMEDKLNGLAITTVVQGLDIAGTSVVATLGAAEKVVWKELKEGWMYIMEEVDNMLEEGDAMIEELLTPPDGWY